MFYVNNCKIETLLVEKPLVRTRIWDYFLSAGDAGRGGAGAAVTQRNVQKTPCTHETKRFPVWGSQANSPPQPPM